jgi:methenyltetrahydrofolate cyclohydrolase
MSTGERSGFSNLDEFLDRVASEESVPAGGSVSALAVAMAAGLVAKVARLSPEWPQAVDVVERAEALLSLATPLAQADADAYTKVLEAREGDVAAALSGAADVPLSVAEAAAEVAALAARAVDEGNTRLRGDAVVAAELAAAGVRGAAELVAVNLAGRDDARVRRAEELAATTDAVVSSLRLRPS